MQASIKRMLADSFHWRDEFAVGHPVIDGAHQTFLDQFGALAQRLDDRADSRALEALFHRLVEDLLRHHADEEDVMDGLRFRGLADHRQSHRILACQAKAALAIGRDGEWVIALRLLSTLVLEHIALEDCHLRPCVRAQQTARAAS